MIKNQSFYQSILQNSILVIKVSGKICDNQENIENVISDIKELLNSISKLKVVLVFGFGRQLDNYMINVHGIEPKKLNGRRITSSHDIEAAKKISGHTLNQSQRGRRTLNKSHRLQRSQIHLTATLNKSQRSRREALTSKACMNRSACGAAFGLPSGVAHTLCES